MKKLSLFLLFTLVSCGNKKHDIKEFYNFEACKNMGHRLGGDIVGRDNSIWAMDRIMPMQSDNCFKCWEFDVNSSKDVPVVFHDKKYRGTRVHKIPSRKIPGHTFHEMIQAFLDRRESLYKPFCVDIKKVRFSDFVIIKRDMDLVGDYIFLTHEDRKKELAKHIKYATDNGIRFSYYD